MSGSLYASLSPSKKRRGSSPDDDDVLTPKRLRTAVSTPSSSASRKSEKSSEPVLPHHLSRLQTIQTGLQHALSHSLATCAVSPTSDTGIVRNVLTHLSLTNYSGLATQVTVDDIRRLCWLWEWDCKSVPPPKDAFADPDENPFLEDVPSQPPKDWTRGAMGIVISGASHFSKTEGRRLPAYGIGIEVEMDIDKNMKEGIAAVARWTSASEERRKEFSRKLRCWVDLHHSSLKIPDVPFADLPKLNTATKTSSLTNALLSSSPKNSPKKNSLSSPTKSGSFSPSKRDFAVPFPVLSPSKSPTKSSLPFPQTPHRNRVDSGSSSLTPRTPRTSLTANAETPTSLPSTPVHQRGQNATTAPQTPSSSRRQALYERVRQKSLTSSPVKAKSLESHHGSASLTRDQMLKFGQEELRRRCLLGRLSGVAESVWMLFTGPVSSSATTVTTRKRRALPASDVASSVIKSSPVPISLAEANESLDMLMKLCPFFLKPLKIGAEEWLEMPAPTTPSPDQSPSKVSPVKGSSPKGRPVAPPSPGSGKSKEVINDQLLHRSPKRVKNESGGLREVREIIRREMELQD